MMTNGSVDYLNLLDDFGFEKTKPTDTSSLAIVFFLQTLVCLVVNGFTFAYLLCCQKYKQNAKYFILTHYFAFKLVFAVVLCVTLLMSSVFEDTSFHVAPSNWLCRLEFFSNMFMETCENYLLFFLWLILLAEREFIGFKYLNVEENTLPVAEGQVNSQILRDTSIRKWCRHHSRDIFLGLFYSITGLLTLLFALDVEKMNILGYKKGVCVTKSVFSLPIYLFANFPLIFWFILFSSLLWKLFGGSRDPNLNRLEARELKLLKFIKLASLLRAAEVLFIHTQVTFLQLFWKIDFQVVEMSRISGFFVIFVTAVLFMYYEGLFGGLSRVDVDDIPVHRIRTFIRESREGSVRDSNNIAYANLIE